MFKSNFYFLCIFLSILLLHSCKPRNEVSKTETQKQPKNTVSCPDAGKSVQVQFGTGQEDKEIIVEGHGLKIRQWGDFNTDGFGDFIGFSPDGNSLKNTYQIFVQCKDSEYKKILSKSAHEMYVPGFLEPIRGWQPLYFEYRKCNDPKEDCYGEKQGPKVSYGRYVFEGKEFQLRKEANQVILLDNNRMVSDLPEDGKAYQRSVNSRLRGLQDHFEYFKTTFLKVEKSKQVIFSLVNGELHTLASPPSMPDAKKAEYKFLHFYRDLEMVAFEEKLNGNKQVKLIDLKTGTTSDLAAIPVFNQDGKYFVTCSGSLQDTGKKRELAFYRCEEGKIQPLRVLPVQEVFLQHPQWLSNGKLECLRTWLDADGEERYARSQVQFRAMR